MGKGSRGRGSPVDVLCSRNVRHFCSRTSSPGGAMPSTCKFSELQQTVLNLMPGVDIPSPLSSFLACQQHFKAAAPPSWGGGDKQQPASLLAGSEGAPAADAARILIPAQSNESWRTQFKQCDLISPFLSMAIQIKLPSFHLKTR